MDTTLEFPSSSSTPWCGGLRESDVDYVIFPNSGELLSNSGELFPRRLSSLAEGEHTIAFVSSIPFCFDIQSTVSWSFPSNPLCLLFLCLHHWSRPPCRSPPPADSRLLQPSLPLVSTHMRSPSPPLSVPHFTRASSCP
jgi:hypothetical protein